MKLCRGCNTEKTLDDFYLDRGKADGHCSRCKECVKAAGRARWQADPEKEKLRADTWKAKNRERSLHGQRRYRLGITETLEELTELRKQQGDDCAICHRPESEVGTLHLDHDHTTGKVRGFLCGSCNRGIGYLQDSPEILTAAAAYLTRDAR